LEAAEQPAGERGRALLLAHAGVDHQYHAGQGRDRPLQRFGGVGPWPRSRGCRHWGRRHPWTRTAPSGRAGPQHQQARPPQRPWRYAGAPDGRVGQPGLPAPLGTNPPRTHPFAPYGRQRPGKTAVRTALSPRYLIRMRPLVQVQPGPENRPLTSRNAGRLASRCQPDRMHPIGDEVLRGASYPGGGTTRLSSLFTAPTVVGVPEMVGCTALSERILVLGPARWPGPRRRTRRQRPPTDGGVFLGCAGVLAALRLHSYRPLHPASGGEAVPLVSMRVSAPFSTARSLPYHAVGVRLV
jgi:hypothetical protein